MAVSFTSAKSFKGKWKGWGCYVLAMIFLTGLSVCWFSRFVDSAGFTDDDDLCSGWYGTVRCFCWWWYPSYSNLDFGINILVVPLTVPTLMPNAMKPPALVGIMKPESKPLPLVQNPEMEDVQVERSVSLSKHYWTYCQNTIETDCQTLYLLPYTIRDEESIYCHTVSEKRNQSIVIHYWRGINLLLNTMFYCIWCK